MRILMEIDSYFLPPHWNAQALLIQSCVSGHKSNPSLGMAEIVKLTSVKVNPSGDNKASEANYHLIKEPPAHGINHF